MTSEGNKTSAPPRLRTLEQLRDRTDELELIISSLTIFALVTLPGWLFETYANVYTHLSDRMIIAGIMGITLVTGVSYALAACFVVHLMTRAYWVGLIGLRTVFPEGINWSKTPGMGPITRQRFKVTLPDLETSIERTDRLASSLFAVISLVTVGMLWMGIIMLVTLVIAVQIGARFGLTNAAVGIGALMIVIVFAGLPSLLWILDALLAARIPRLQNHRFFAGFVRILGRINGFVYPQRLILPVQLTLASNTRPLIFYAAFTLGITAIIVVGSTRFAAWQSFSVSSEFSYMDATTVTDGFRSTYYEDMSSPKDRLRAWPRIDTFTQKGSYVRLFLPYHPLRDNLMLESQCIDPDEDTSARIDCLREIWSVRINDKLVPMSGFETAERMDINMRGLIGLVPLAGLEPGMHTINVDWNPDGIDIEDLVDDRYAANSRSFRIPVAFMPDYELALPLPDKPLISPEPE